jgi:hypothetical protein
VLSRFALAPLAILFMPLRGGIEEEYREFLRLHGISFEERYLL